MSFERRQSYRVRWDGRSVRVHLLLPRLGRWLEVQPLDTSARGLGVLVPPQVAALVRIGETVVAKLFVAASRREVELRAIVRNARPSAPQVAMGLELLDAARLHSGASPEVHALFNRRRALRMRTTSKNPLRITLATGRRQVTAFAHDISIEGISAVVLEPLVVGTPLNFALQVVREDVSVNCRAVVVHRLPTSFGPIFGLSFDKAYLGYGYVSEAAARYVQDRQRELLQIPNA